MLTSSCGSDVVALFPLVLDSRLIFCPSLFLVLHFLCMCSVLLRPGCDVSVV